MSKLTAAALIAALAVLPALARAQEDAYASEPEAAPEGAAPTWAPPAPPAQTPAPPQAQPQPQQAPAPPGQWIYTSQYGWVWMAYSDSYTSVPANGWGEPYAYVYYPSYAAWTWVAAPWIWGFGPWPFFGVWGPARFGWYGHGWWRSPAHFHYAPARAWYPGGGFRAAPRGGAVWVGGSHVAPSRVFRGGWGGGHAMVRGGGGHGGGRGGHGR
jgi:hypothetical protein